MPTYRAKVRMLIAHESKLVEAGETFDTIFPKVKTKGGEVDMKLGDNLELVEDEPAGDEPKKAVKGKPAS